MKRKPNLRCDLNVDCLLSRLSCEKKELAINNFIDEVKKKEEGERGKCIKNRLLSKVNIKLKWNRQELIFIDEGK